MIGNSRFRDCVIANIDGHIKALEGIFENYDENSDTKFYIYRNIINGQEDIAFDINILNSISYYMNEDELDRYLVDYLSLDEKYNIIARAIYQERQALIKNQGKEIKKILKP